MVRTLLDRDEFAESFGGSQHANDALEAPGRHSRVVGMAGGSDLVLVADGNDAVEEIRDPLPGDVGRDLSGPGQRRILAGIGQPPRAVARAAPTGSRPGSQDPQEAHVVLERRDPGLGAGRDHLLNVFDVAIALGTFPQHDRAAGLAVDMARRQEWQGHHVQRDAVLSHKGHASAADRRRSRLPLRRVRRISADVVDPMPLQVLQHPRGRGPLLGSHVHLHRLAGSSLSSLPLPPRQSHLRGSCRLEPARSRSQSLRETTFGS